MSQATSCCSQACDPAIVEIPGSPGSDGAAGANGISAFSFTSANFEVPAQSANVTVSVSTSAWMTIGQPVWVEGAGMFEVVSFPSSISVVLEYLTNSGNTHTGDTISAGSQISPGGTEPTLATPWSIANGGTGANNRGDAQDELGLGLDITQKSVGVIAYDVTNVYTTISGMSGGLSVNGLYLFQGWVTVVFTDVTFIASRTISMRIRDVTNAATLTEKVVQTGIQATTTFPAIDYVLPNKTATIVGATTFELQIFIDTVETNGSTVVTSAGFSATPLALDP